MKGWLLFLCALAFAITFFAAADKFGLGGRPWYGWWDSNFHPIRAFTVGIGAPVSGGASALGGLRNGDVVDLRKQNTDARFAVLYQLMGTQPVTLLAERGTSAVRLDVTGSTIWEGAWVWKLAVMLSVTIANLWFVGCALLVVLRRHERRDAATLALVLLFITGFQLNPTFFVVPWTWLHLVLLVGSQASLCAALILLIALSSRFGERSAARTWIEWLGRGFVGLFFLSAVAASVGIATLWFDPTPFVDRISPVPGMFGIPASLLTVLAAVMAISSSAAPDRPRVAWTLMPLPIAILAFSSLGTLGALIVGSSWFAIVGESAFVNATWLAGAWIVTYALLKRRVLDFEFVLSRALVVGAVSAIVVASFVLLEWLLGTTLAGVSHATGLIANGALALVLGLSLNPIHKRVDRFIESSFFHKRHQNERALLDFSKEAAYVTDSQALLDQAAERLAKHTDARDAAILLEAEGAFVAARSFGNGTIETIDENDPAILALKTWHKPLDPHRYSGAMRGALAAPMLARGRLLGLIVLGERSGGEAYAPDEIEALSQFTHGVGSAYDVLVSARDDSIVELRASMAAMADAIARLGRETSALRRVEGG
jgi:hypothetical protein